MFHNIILLMWAVIIGCSFYIGFKTPKSQLKLIIYLLVILNISMGIVVYFMSKY